MRLLPLCTAVLLTTALTLAQSVTLPAAASQWTGRWGNQTLLFNNAWSSGVANEARTQLLYSLAEIPAAFQVVQSLAFRQRGEPVPNTAGTIDLDIRMSLSTQNADQPSSTFAQNVGAAPQQVFFGAVNVPASAGGPWPTPWNVVVPLQSPFVLVPAAGETTLVIDVRCWNSTASQPWLVELYDRDAGLIETELIQMDCFDPNGMPNASWTMAGDLCVTGGQLALAFYNYPNNQPSLQVNALAIGFQGVGGSYLGMQLPAFLAAAGVQSAANCRWTVDILATMPMVYRVQQGMGYLDSFGTIPIPNVQSLVGMRLVAQDAGLMQYASGLQVFPSAAVAVTIRSGAFPVGSIVTDTGNRNSTSGLASPRQPISMELR